MKGGVAAGGSRGAAELTESAALISEERASLVLSPLQVLSQRQVHVVPRERFQNVEGEDA